MISLKEVTASGDLKTFHFVRLRSDGIELDSLNISVDSASVIRSMEILHNIEGDAAFAANGEVLHCTAWESEADAQAASDWSKHYTVRVGTWQGGKSEALRIFGNLKRAIHDTYLKHLLGVFPLKTNPLVFDADLYSIPVPIREPEIASAAAAMPEENQLPQSFLRRHILSNKRRRIVTAAAALLLVASGVFAINRFSRREPVPAEAQKLLSRNLLPVLPLLEKDLHTIQSELKMAVFPAPDPVLAKDIIFKNVDDFLDQLYPLDREEQVRIFHAAVMINKELSDRKKAEILRRLYQDNLIRIITNNGVNPAQLTYNYLRHQDNKRSLIEYLVTLTTRYPQSAVAREASLILANLVEIQQLIFSSVLFRDEISNLCRSAESFPDFREQVICANYRQYHRWRVIDKAELKKKFNHLQGEILQNSIRENASNYRLNDAKLELANMYMRQAETTGEWEQGWKWLNAIQINDGEFLFRRPYNELNKLFAGKGNLGASIEAEAKEDEVLREKTAELELQRSQFEKRKTSLSKLKEFGYAAWREYYEKQANARIARDEKFSKKLSK